MKRPMPFYLVTCWLCLGMFFLLGSVGRLAAGYQQAGEPVPPYISLLAVAALVFAVWLVWGFIRLRPLERWICALFFAYWGISATSRMARLLLVADSHRPIRVMIAMCAIWLAVFIPNVASIVYLFTRRFHEFAVWYVQEKRRAEMQAYAQKQIAKNLKG